MLNRKTYHPVRAITFKGKILVKSVRFLYSVRKFFGGKDYDEPLENHHEDPLKMKRRHQLFFGHKYYYKAITHQTAGQETITYFREKAIDKNDFPEREAEKKITLTVGGDLMPYHCITSAQCSSIWDEAGDFFFNADIVCANLETPLDKNKAASYVPEVMLNNMYFNASEDMFSVFSGLGKYRGYDVLSVANNHSLDQDENGLINTIKFLEEKNIAYCGAATSAETLHDFPIIEKNGIKIAFIAFTYSLNAKVRPAGKEYLVNHLAINEENPDLTLVETQCRIARERGADLIAGMFHMGCAYQPYPSPQIIKNTHRICALGGIDLFLGGHPHNPMPVESLEITDPFSGKKKKSFIVYSQGDFIAYDIFKWCRLPLLFRFTIGKTGNDTFIAGIESKLFYNHAQVKNGKIESLRLLDYTELKNHPEKLAGNPEAEKEFEELQLFAEHFLLPGNLEHFLI